MPPPEPDLSPRPPLAARLLDLRPGEGALVGWSCAYFFLLLSSYYVIRPVREAMGLTGGVDELPRLFLATLGVMLLANPLFAALVSRSRRGVFIPTVYLFFAANLLVFWVLFRARGGRDDIWIARSFYVWVSVFNLFAVSVFWSFMVELFRTGQSKRLFGMIGLGGSIGAFIGSATTDVLAERLGEVNLLPVSIALLVAACGCVLRLNRLAGRAGPGDASAPAAEGDVPVSGGMLAGLVAVARSPYLLGIGVYLFMYSLSATFAYFIQGSIVAEAAIDRSERAALFARIDWIQSLATIFIQAFLTGRIIRRIGVGFTLAILPAATIAGFVVLALMPTLPVIVAFQALRRTSNFALAKPARESLFTVVSREEKYKAKNLIDTFVHRGGDAVGSIVYEKLGAGLKTVAAATSTVTFIAVPMGVVWLGLSVWLGRRQQTRAEATDDRDRL